jgi:hypothetical protein
MLSRIHILTWSVSLNVDSCKMKKSDFSVLKRFNRSSIGGLTAVQSRFSRSDWGLPRFDIPTFDSFRFISNKKSSTFEESRTSESPIMNRGLTEVWSWFLRGSTLIADRVIGQQKVKKPSVTRQNLFDIAENRSDRSRTAVQLKLDQQSNRDWTFIANLRQTSEVEPSNLIIFRESRSWTAVRPRFSEVS